MTKSRKLDFTKKREDKQKRSVSFTKRRHGLFNKATELYMFCDAQLALLVSSPCSNKIYSYGLPSVDVILDAFLGNRVPTSINNMEKQYVFSLMNEIEDLEHETKKNSEDVTTEFSSIFKFFESSESIEELQVIVDSLRKLIDKVKSKVENNSISWETSNDMGGEILNMVQQQSLD